jgi:hypothetical protein
VPKSKVRKKTAYVPPAATTSGLTGSKAPKPSPTWWGPALAGFLVIGLAYIVTYYVASEKVPVMKDIGSWNFAVGFGFLLTGLTMAVKWR